MTSDLPPTSPGDVAPVLEAVDLTLGYDGRWVATGLGIRIAPRELTAIVGPNACGKSTLLRALARVLTPESGVVTLDGVPVRELASKQFARQVALLPQTAIAPDGISVADLVARGRYPHQSFFRQWSAGDERAVGAAMAATGVADLASRTVEELSGGQRQRVWIATVLAQETPILLLDEPTTFLDIAHQIEVLELCRALNRDRGVTVVAVLHDLNHAARYADRIVMMREGAIVAEGSPADVLTEERVEHAFGLACRVVEDPVAGTPLVLPLGSAR
ncbi:ABC transporter ATP-binding protein [Microbacterium ulmi]|uniref:ABC transporter ATP-binding protein n=1 Tax=Microbacterium ulmi TaxID=179095 RepID=A0A7Y2LXA8_9MICO|nr:ABC transporter ATP-binding protein [Microbacterium ulmi]NII71231.1 iron complex transport system ATP-binding protein [Microbacterium ulmi]NNH02536.1 ABC transporter ATP-binding protein [Microbacterium ulmi]